MNFLFLEEAYSAFWLSDRSAFGKGTRRGTSLGGPQVLGRANSAGLDWLDFSDLDREPASSWEAEMPPPPKTRDSLGLYHGSPPEPTFGILGAVPERALFDELVGLLTQQGIEVRIEHFKAPSQRGGGYCKVEGKRTVILDAQASPPQMAQALLEALEEMGFVELGLRGQDLSPELLQRLTRRGQMPWPRLADAPPPKRARPRFRPGRGVKGR